MDGKKEFPLWDGVQQQLITLSKNNDIFEELRKYLKCWNYQSVSNLETLREEIIQVSEELVEIVFPDLKEDLTEIMCCFTYSEIYDHVISAVREKFASDDLKLLKLSKEFCNKNGSPKQLGKTFYNFVPNAAVVELSMLNIKRTPGDKLQCLCLAYDYIFVEVKSALISVISKYSDKENDIPIVNNQDVIPIVMAVILKSKLFYLISDLYYIAFFGDDIIKSNQHASNVYNIFEESVNALLGESKERYKSSNSSETLEKNLSVCETINFIEEMEKRTVNKETIFDEETQRVARLITSATTEDLLGLDK